VSGGAGRRLKLYVRQGCHLCEDMQDRLRALDSELGLGLEVVDIDRDPELQALYHTRVPVLATLEGEICEYFLDEVALRRWVAAPAQA